MDYGFEHPGFEPTLALLVDRVPRWQIMRHQPPRGPCADDPAQAIEDFSQAMLALGSLFGYEGQIGGDKRPFIITDIAGVGVAFHTASVASAR
jgi:hypothetical protein